MHRGISAMLALGMLFTASLTLQAQTAYSFPAAVPVGGTAQVEAIPVKVQSGGTLGTIAVLTQGKAGLDFTLSSGCTKGILYSAGQTCTVSVQFAPLYPGLRQGAIELLDGSGNLMATELVNGIGQGPLSVMEPGELTTVAGNGHLADTGTGSTSALGTAIHEPLGVATDGAGNLFYTDSGNNVIRRVDAATGTVTTVAGTGSSGFSANGTLARNALLNTPSGLVLDGAGNLYFADSGNNAVREIVLATGQIETIAGTGALGYTGDSGLATAASLNGPQGLAFDASGNLYIADTGNNVVRAVSAATGDISTVAGNGTAGYQGDGGTATAAELNTPWGVFAATNGKLYIADFGNNAIRTVSGGTIATIIGDGTPSYSGDGGPAGQATLNRPTAVVLDAAGDILIADSENNCVRKVNGTTLTIVTIAGNGVGGYGGDGLDANVSTAQFNKIYGLSLDGAGDFYVADRLGLRIREVYGTIASIYYQPIKATNTSAPVVQTIESDGNATLTIASVVATTNSAINAAETTCSSAMPLLVGGTCAVGAEFKPVTVGSPVSGLITINSNSANTPISIDLSGNSLSIFPTTTTVTGAPNPASLGTAVTFTATVTSANTQALSGTVSFYDGTTLLGGVAQILNSSTGTASYTTTNLALGSHTITAVYSGDSGDATSTSMAFVEVIKQATTFTIVGVPNPATVYQQITFTATIAPANTGGVAPTGNVVFSADGNLLPNGTVTLVPGTTSSTATYSTSLLGEGTHAITGSYAGDTNNLANNATPYSEVVNSAVSTTTLTTSNASVALGTSVTFTATVTGVPNSTPTGNVVFKDGTNTLGTVALNGLGVAAFTTSTLTTGTHSITAVYQGDNDYGASTSPAVTEIVGQIATTTAIATSANPAIAGASIQFTVTVTAASSTTPNIPITGTVTLTQGTTVLGTGNVKAGATGPATATFTVAISNFTPGSPTIDAVYSGDTNYTTSTNSVNLVISIATTTTALTGTPSTVIATNPVTLTATVTGNGGVPTGNVSFMDGATLVGTAKVNGSGVAAITTTTLAVGSHTIIANYVGDTDDSPSSSNSVAITVQIATTTITLTPSQNPTSYGQGLNLTAAVTGNGGTPTGSVTFYDGTTALGTVPLTNGTALLSTATLADGTHPITASYSGDTNDAASVSGVLSELVLETTTLTLTSPSPNPSVARANVQFIATITGLQGIAATGNITFLDGTNVLGTAPISGTTATFNTTNLAVGNHQIIASFQGSTTVAAVNSPPYPQAINAAGTSITIASSANPATYGTPLTLTATATSTVGSLTGTVIFQDSGVSIGQGTLSGGVATLTTSTLAPGLHTIVAAYQGDANDAPGSSSPLLETVELPTTTTLSSSQNPLLTLAAVNIIATVANGRTTAATGTVNFTEDGVAAGSAPLVAGIATLALTSLPAGSHTFVATYAGDAVDLTSTANAFVETVQLRPTTDALDSSSTSLTGGQQITLTSIVRWTGPVTPTGTATFMNGATVLGTATLDGQGLASLTVLLSGTSATITSSYSGDANYAASTSAPTTVTITAAPTVSLTVTPSTFSMQSGKYTNVSVGLASINGFTDTFALGCNGLPYAATCTFAQDQVKLAAGGAKIIGLTVDTGNPLTGGGQADNDGGPRGSSRTLLFATLLPGAVLLLCFARPGKRLRRWKGLLLVLCMAGVGSAMSGCASVQNNPTPVGNYTFEVTAVGATGVTQYVTVTMMITQ